MKQALVFSAGLGTRLQPLTNTRPKALVHVAGQPLLWHVLTKLRESGYERVVVNVHHFASQIVDYLKSNDFGMSVLVSDETLQLLDTGGGIKHARELFADDSPILIHNVDILSNVDLNWFSRQHLDDEDAVLLVSRRNTKRYLLFDSAMRLMGWINTETGEVRSPYPWLRTADITIDDHLIVRTKANPTEAVGSQAQLGNGRDSGNLNTLHTSLYAFAFSGIHSFSPRLFPLMDRFPDRFSIIDFYLSVCHRSRIVGCVKDNLRLLDVGKHDSLTEAEQFLITL